MKGEDRVVPRDGENPYASHPGFDAGDCELRYTVTKKDAWGGFAGGGFGCEYSGGHCLPGEGCAQRRHEAREQDERRQFFKECLC